MTTQLNQLTELTVTSDDDLILIREDSTGVDKRMRAQNIRAKATTKGDVGLANVPNLDTTDAVSKAHDQNTDTALAQGTGDQVTASEARSHIDATDNPHNVTKAQVGLADVDNVSAADLRDRSTHTGAQTLATISDAGTAAAASADDFATAAQGSLANTALQPADVGTIATQDANDVAITGGAIDDTPIGGTTAESGAFTTLGASGTITVGQDYTETLASSTGSTTIDLSNGTVFKVTTDGNNTITLPSSTAGKSFLVLVEYGGSHTITWAGGSDLYWPDGQAPDLTSEEDAVDVFAFFQDGDNTYGVPSAQGLESV